MYCSKQGGLGSLLFHFRILAEIPQVISCKDTALTPRSILLLSYSVLVLYCSYQQTTHHSSMSNTQHILHQHLHSMYATKVYAPIKCHHAYVQMPLTPLQMQSIKTYYSNTFDPLQEVSNSSKLNFGRFTLHGAQQVVQLFVDLGLIDTCAKTDDRSILVSQF
jgi:hypothetical protein